LDAGGNLRLDIINKMKSKRIIAYMVVRSPDTDSVVREVNDYIREGFEPYGGIATANSEGAAANYVQPMVKYDERFEE
jgi:hypothetical protein